MKLDHIRVADTTDASLNDESSPTASPSSASHSCSSRQSHDHQQTSCPHLWTLPPSFSPTFPPPLKRRKTPWGALSIPRALRSFTSMNVTSGTFKPPKTLSVYAMIPLGIYLLSAPLILKMDTVLRSAVHVFLVISLLLSSCCCGHVINKPLPPLFGRYPRAAPNTPSIAPPLPYAPSPYSSPSLPPPSSSSSSSSPSSSSSSSSNSSQYNNLGSTVDDGASRNETEAYMKTLEPLLTNATKSQLVAVLISTLEKLGTIPTSNASFCLVLERISDGLKADSSSKSAFDLQLSFSLNVPGDSGAPSEESKDDVNGSSDDVTHVSPNAQNITTTSTCISDPEIVVTLALIAGVNGIPRMEGGNDTAGFISGGSGGSDGGYQSGVYGILETGKLSRTQVVVISTCSAIIGMFFLAAAFLRIRNYIKRFRFEQANAKRKKFRSCSVALRNPSSSMEQLRRESLGSKNSQQNSYSTKGSNASQTNVSSREHSSAGSLRQDPDTTPLLVITKATVEQAATPTDTQSIAGQTSCDQTIFHPETASPRPRSSNTSPNPSIRTGSQPELSHESQSRCNTPDLATNGSYSATRQVQQDTSPLQGHLNHSYSHPRFLGSEASVVPAPHPKLASLKSRERGLVRASSLGTDRNIRRQEFTRGSFKNRGGRRGNKVHSKSDASSYRRLAGEPSLEHQQQQDSFDTNSIGLSCDLLKNYSFDSTNSSSINGSCLTCDAISRRLDLICNSVRVAHCPFNVPVSRMPMQYSKTPGKTSKLDMMGGSLDYGYRMSPLCSELQYAKRHATFSVDGQAVSPGETWKSANSFPGASASLEQMRTSPLPRDRHLWPTLENDGVQSSGYSSPYYGDRNSAYQPIPESVCSENLLNVHPNSSVDVPNQGMNKNLLGGGGRKHPMLTKSVSVCVDSFSEDATPEFSLDREKASLNVTLNSSQDQLSKDEIASRQSPSSDILNLDIYTRVRYITPGSSMGDNVNADENNGNISDNQTGHIEFDSSRTREAYERPMKSDHIGETLVSESPTRCSGSDSGVKGLDSDSMGQADTSCVEVLSHKKLENQDSDTLGVQTSDTFISCPGVTENISNKLNDIKAGEDSDKIETLSDGAESNDPTSHVRGGSLKYMYSPKESLPSSPSSPCASSDTDRTSSMDGDDSDIRRGQFCDNELQHEVATVKKSDDSENTSAEVSTSSVECENLNETNCSEPKRSQPSSFSPPLVETTPVSLDDNGVCNFHGDESREHVQDVKNNGPLSPLPSPTESSHYYNSNSSTSVDKITSSNSHDSSGVCSMITAPDIESEDPSEL